MSLPDPTDLIAAFPRTAQGAKMLIRYAANFFGAVLAVQTLGWQAFLKAEIPLTIWQSLALFVAFFVLELMVGEGQEAARGNGIGGSRPPPAPGGAPFDP